MLTAVIVVSPFLSKTWSQGIFLVVRSLLLPIYGILFWSVFTLLAIFRVTPWVFMVYRRIIDIASSRFIITHD